MKRSAMNKILALAVGLLALTACSAFAEDTNGADLTAPPAANGDNAPAVLAGTLKKVRDSGAITIGYREASFPFSYVANGRGRAARLFHRSLPGRRRRNRARTERRRQSASTINW